MIAIPIIGILFVVFLVGALIIQNKSKNAPARPRLPPGPKPASKEDGNNGDIVKSGGLVKFLYDTHKKYGPAVSFYFGKILCVSLTTPELWAQHKKAYNKPHEIFDLWRFILGDKSIQYANGEDAKRKRRILARHLASKNVKRLYPMFNQFAEEMAKEWSSASDKSVHLQSSMLYLAMNTIAKAAVGGAVAEDSVVRQLAIHAQTCVDEIVLRLEGNFPEEGSQRQKNIDTAISELRGKIRQEALKRRENQPEEHDKLYIDFIIDDGADDDELEDDVLTHLLGGSHTPSESMTWMMFFLAQHPDIQQKIYEEIKREIGDEPVTSLNMDKLKYIQQCIDETFRLSTVITLSARIQDEEQIINGYKIPKGTTVIHALAVQHTDTQYWEKPDEFNPDRFSPEQRKSRSPMTFQPFGFAGQRICPAVKYSYAVLTSWLTVFVKQYRFKLKDKDMHNITGNYRILNAALGQIHLTLEKRN